MRRTALWPLHCRSRSAYARGCEGVFCGWGIGELRSTARPMADGQCPPSTSRTAMFVTTDPLVSSAFGSPHATACSTSRRGCPGAVAQGAPGATRGTLRSHQTSSSKPSAQFGWVCARRIRRSRILFSGVRRVGAGDSGLGPLPADAEAGQGGADGHARDPGRSQPFGVRGRGRQLQRPETGRVAEVAGGAVEQVAQARGRGRVERRGTGCGAVWSPESGPLRPSARRHGRRRAGSGRSSRGRRKVKAWDERRPAARASRSASVSGRTHKGTCMLRT